MPEPYARRGARPSGLSRAIRAAIYGVLERPLVFGTGKGGVGKTTVAAELVRAAAPQGRTPLRTPRAWRRRLGIAPRWMWCWSNTAVCAGAPRRPSSPGLTTPRDDDGARRSAPRP